MKTPITKKEVISRTVSEVRPIDLGRIVLFFDDNTYHVTDGLSSVPLRRSQKLELGILTVDELEQYDQELQAALTSVAGDIIVFLAGYPEMTIDDITKRVSQ